MSSFIVHELHEFLRWEDQKSVKSVRSVCGGSFSFSVLTRVFSVFFCGLFYNAVHELHEFYKGEKV